MFAQVLFNPQNTISFQWKRHLAVNTVGPLAEQLQLSKTDVLRGDCDTQLLIKSYQVFVISEIRKYLAHLHITAFRIGC